MAPLRNARVLFSEVPPKMPEPGKHITYDDSAKIDLSSVRLDGGVLLRNLVISVDPYMRGRMRDASVKSYSEAFPLGEPMTNHGVGKVIRSEHSGFKEGDTIFAITRFEEYSVISKSDLDGPVPRVIPNKEGLPWSKWVGACGMPGHTAYYAFYEIGKPKKGETIFVSAASGAVGQVVGQLAKREGLKVIGSCGSDEKVKFLREELGFDHVFNYKTSDTAKELAKLPNGFDIFWDNVGGATLDAALGTANRYARFIESGMISAYNGQEPYTLKNIMQIVGKSIHMEGFIILHEWSRRAEDFYRDMPTWVASGEVKTKEDVTKGLAAAPDAIVGIFEGKNFGKALVEIWDGSE